MLSPGKKVHVMHRGSFEKAGKRTLIGAAEPCEAGVASIRGHIYTEDAAKGVPTREPETVTRFISLVTGEHLVTPLPQTVSLEHLVYRQEPQGLYLTDGSAWGVHLSTLSLQ